MQFAISTSASMIGQPGPRHFSGAQTSGLDTGRLRSAARKAAGRFTSQGSEAIYAHYPGLGRDDRPRTVEGRLPPVA